MLCIFVSSFLLLLLFLFISLSHQLGWLLLIVIVIVVGICCLLFHLRWFHLNRIDCLHSCNKITSGGKYAKNLRQMINIKWKREKKTIHFQYSIRCLFAHDLFAYFSSEGAPLTTCFFIGFFFFFLLVLSHFLSFVRSFVRWSLIPLVTETLWTLILLANKQNENAFDY